MENKRVAAPSDRLREAMQTAKKKQSELAKETGIDKSSISNYLSGKYEPKHKAIALLARALDVDEMWLWGCDVPKERSVNSKKNDAMVGVVARIRKDPDFFDFVSMVAELPADQYASIKQLVSALVNK